VTVEPLTAGRPATTDAPAPSVTVTAAKLELTGSLNLSTTAGGGTVTVDPAAGVIDVSAAWADAARAVASEENTASSMDSTATQTAIRMTRLLPSESMNTPAIFPHSHTRPIRRASTDPTLTPILTRCADGSHPPGGMSASRPRA
jgi:hypothetical protein